MIVGSYYSTFNTSVIELTAPEDNLRPGPRECCSSCLAVAECNSWQWCARRLALALLAHWLAPCCCPPTFQPPARCRCLRRAPHGACVAAEPATLLRPQPAHCPACPPCACPASAPPHPRPRRCKSPSGCVAPSSNGTFPAHGCQLLDLSAFLAANLSTRVIRESGADVPFVAGGCWGVRSRFWAGGGVRPCGGMRPRCVAGGCRRPWELRCAIPVCLTRACCMSSGGGGGAGGSGGSGLGVGLGGSHACTGFLGLGGSLARGRGCFLPGMSCRLARPALPTATPPRTDAARAPPPLPAGPLRALPSQARPSGSRSRSSPATRLMLARTWAQGSTCPAKALSLNTAASSTTPHRWGTFAAVAVLPGGASGIVCGRGWASGAVGACVGEGVGWGEVG